jgi:PAS domain S-box-containing protein
VLIELSNYAFEPLRADEEYILYSGRRDGELSAILAVAPVSEYPALQSLERLEHEFSLRDELDSAWAARPLALAHHLGRRTLVLEDPGGTPLDALLGQPLELPRFLHLAAGISAALGRLHQRGLIHKDIKPANILVDSATDDVWLTGFGIASCLPRERQTPEPPEMIAGTLAYMAPEQTGRMNRSIDFRSDLYSLGVTLYRMLTGVLPFIAADPMEWVHCHIARQPVPPDKRTKHVPGTVSAIIMKLLAKTAEERYQTAAGLETDLRRCLAEWESRGRVDPFPLGAHDASDRLLIPEKLYGREREIAALLSAFDRVVAHGAPELVLVSGYSGIGKSSVVNELQKALVPSRGLFAAGKFDRYKRDIPYTTLAQAFRTLVRQILARSEAEVRQWRSALREALGPNGRLIVNLIPELEFVIGRQPPVQELAPQDAQNRFQMAFRRFLGALARPEHPLALFLDDLQWLDAATLQLLERLIIEQEVRHLLLVGAYRDNEVSPSHPLMRTLASIHRAGANTHEIVLAPLAVDDASRLVADTLHCQPNSAQPLAELVHEKTGGNPFFGIQFLAALAEERLLVFDSAAAAWTWDLARIRAKGYTDNVVDLMARKLNSLPDTTQEALGQLACLGNVAEIATLTLVRGESEEETHGALWEAVRAGLIFRLDGAYTFLHDHVQEAAYAFIPEDERAAVHLRIGRLFVSRTTPAEIEGKIFEIVNQLDRGIELIQSLEERVRAAELNLIAGKRAKTSTAYASAQTYFVAGRALLPEDSWERQYALTFTLEVHLAESEFLNGDFAAAEQRLSKLSRRAEDLVDSAAVTRLQTELYTALDQSDRAVEVGLEYLRRVDVDWSPHPTKDEVRQEYERIGRQLGSRPIEALVDLPPMTDPVCRATLDVLAAVEEPAHFTDENLRCLVVARIVNLSLEHGNSDGSCLAYVHLGWFIGPRFGDHQAAFRFGKLGLDLVEKRGLQRSRARVSQCFGYFVNPWSRHMRTGLELLRRSFPAAQEAGDLKYAVYSCDRLVTILLATGDSLGKVQQEAEHGLEFARKARFGYIVDIIIGQLMFIRALRGLTSSLSSFNDTEFDEGRFEQHLKANPKPVFATCWYWIRKLQAHFYAGDYSSALAAASKAEPLIQTGPGHFESVEYLFYDALAQAAQYDFASSEERPRLLEALAADRTQINLLAEHCPENFSNRAALVHAEIARIEGRELDAQRLYEQAIRSARDNGFTQNEGIANELAAKFYLARGYETSGNAYLRNARHCYLRWGALGKVRQLDQHYPHLREERAPGSSTTTIGTPLEQLDLGTVIKASQAVCSEIVTGRLMETLMVIAMENAGADRGLLILLRGEEPQIEAEALTGCDRVELMLREVPVTPSELPESVLHYVIRTRQSVILDDAATPTLFSADPYVQRRRPRSVLCLPLVKQAKLLGVLYLENNLMPRVFTPHRLKVLELLTSQAAVSLDNARIYTELARLNADLTQENSDRRKAEDALRASEERWRKLFENSSVGIALIAPDGHFLAANQALQEMLGYTEEELQRLTALDVTHEENRTATAALIAEAAKGRRVHRLEKQYVRKDGSVIWAEVNAVFVPASGSRPGFFPTIIVDITERKRAEVNLARLNRTLQTLYQCNQALVRATEEYELLRSVCRILVEVGGLRMAWVGYRELNQEKTVRPVARAGYDEGYLERVIISWGDTETGRGPTGTAVRTGATSWTRDNLTDPQLAPWRVEDLRHGYASSISLPLMCHGEAFGALTLHATEPDAFNESTIEQYTDLANNLAYGVIALQTREERARAENEIRQLNASLEKRVAERTTELVRSEKKFRALFEGTSLAVVLHDENGILEANPSWLRLLGYSGLSEVIGKNPAELSAPIQAGGERAEALIQRHITNTLAKGSERFDWIMLRRDGTELPMEVFLTRIQLGDRQLIQAVCNDITQRKQAEAELVRTLAREKELGQLRSKFVSMVSHEFRTPLGIIQSSAEILEDYLDRLEPGERNDHLRSIRINTRRMAVIMEEVLLIGSFDAGKMEFKPAPLDLLSFVRKLVDEVLSATGQRCPIQLSTFEIPAEMQADDRLLRHIFTNLLTNAVKYSDAGRPVQFEIKGVSGEIVCAIRDQGIGIPEADREWLFNAFHRGHNVDERPGTGLGLVIVKRCVDLHGGRIDVVSKVGEGTTVTVRLPKFSPCPRPARQEHDFAPWTPAKKPSLKL